MSGYQKAEIGAIKKLITDGVERGSFKGEIDHTTPSIFKAVGYDGKIRYGWHYMVIGTLLGIEIETAMHGFMGKDYQKYSYIWQYQQLLQPEHTIFEIGLDN